MVLSQDPRIKEGCKTDVKIKIQEAKLETKPIKSELDQTTTTEVIKATQSCSKSLIKELK